MKKLLLLTLLVAGCIAGVATSQRNPDLDLNWRVNEALSGRSTARPTLHTGVPGVFVRFDDARIEQFTHGHVQAFLRRGIPVTLSINSKPVTAASNGADNGTMTWAQIRTLSTFAAQNGTHLEIANHTYSTFDDDKPFSLDYDNLLRELSADTLFAHLDARPKVIVWPGDTKSSAFIKRNKEYLSSLAYKLGYKYALPADTNQDSLGISLNTPHTATDNTSLTNPGTSPVVRPSVTNDPFWLSTGYTTSDLGNNVVERDASQGSLTTTWTIDGNSGDADANWELPHNWNVGVALGSNGWFAVVMHDSVSSDAIALNIGAGGDPQTYPGHYSPEHVAWQLDALRAADHIRLLTASEWCQEMISGFEAGVDLVDNPTSSIPFYAIGDTFGVDYAWVRGWGSPGWAAAGWSPVDATNMASGAYVEDLSRDAKYLRFFGSEIRNPANRTGTAISGEFGQAGGVRDELADGFIFTAAQLPPGQYSWGFVSTNARTWTNKDFNTYAQLFRHDINGSYAQGATAFVDTFMSYRQTTDNVSIAPTGALSTSWVTKTHYFSVPDIYSSNEASLSPGVTDAILPRAGGGAQNNLLTSGFGYPYKHYWHMTAQAQPNGDTVIGQVFLRYIGPND